MKKKILIGIAIVVAIVIIVISYAVVKDLKQEDKLKQELKELNELANAQNINIDEINKRLESTITTGDYEIVEKAYKQYLKDFFQNSIQIATLLNDEKISDILTANNYTNDGPDFINTKQYLSETIEKLETCKGKYNEFFTEEKAMSYINDKNLDSYYIDFLKNEMMENLPIENQDKTVENPVNQAISLLKNSDKIIDFLISNKGNWQITGENIEFNSDKLVEDYNNMLNSIKEEVSQEQCNTFNKDFGSYEIENGWIESKEYSTNDKFFYVKDGQEQEERPNNIAVNVGTNKYKAEEHEKFRTAILNQLSTQMSGTGATINANGSNTKNNYVLYTFVIYEEKENITTTQYYIVGDYKYVLVHETTYGNSKETDDAARKIINSFKWN